MLKNFKYFQKNIKKTYSENSKNLPINIIKCEPGKRDEIKQKLDQKFESALKSFEPDRRNLFKQFAAFESVEEDLIIFKIIPPEFFKNRDSAPIESNIKMFKKLQEKSQMVPEAAVIFYLGSKDTANTLPNLTGFF